jgi:pimeloyl-ACP methyl ester carboxylesterase
MTRSKWRSRAAPAVRTTRPLGAATGERNGRRGTLGAVSTRAGEVPRASPNDKTETAPAHACRPPRKVQYTVCDHVCPLAQHPDAATTLIYTSDDEFFTPEWERFVARELLAIEPIEIPGGHFPMIEDPDALAQLLDSLAVEMSLSGPVA